MTKEELDRRLEEIRQHCHTAYEESPPGCALEQATLALDKLIDLVEDHIMAPVHVPEGS